MSYLGAPTIKWLPAGAGFVAEIIMDGQIVAPDRVRITPNPNNEGWAYTIDHNYSVSSRTLRGCKTAAANMIRRQAWAYRYDNPPDNVLGDLALPPREPPPVRIDRLIKVKWEDGR